MLMKELLKKKLMEGGKADPMKLEALKNVVQELEDMSDEGMASNLKKVTVASDTEEGLKKGLDMAEDKVEDMSEESPDMESEESSEESDLDSMMDDAKTDERMDMANEEYADEESDYDQMSPEQLELEIEKLKSKLKK